MDADTEALTRDIRRARADLATTLEALGDRIAPKKVVARAKADVAERIETVRERVSPARILERRTEPLRRGIRSVQDSLTERNHDVARGNQLEAGARVTDTVRARSQRLAERTSDVAGTVADRAQRAPGGLRAKAGEHPFVAGFLAFGGGVLVASLVAPSNRERKIARHVTDKAQPVKDKAIEAGRSVADEIQQTAQDRAAQVKKQAGQAADEVKQQARASTQRTKGQAKKATTQVKRQTKAATGQVKAAAKRAPTTTATTATRATATTKAKTWKSAPAKKVVAPRR